MRRIPFTKMQGTGNDYIYIDCTREEVLAQEEVAPFAIRFSDRHFGIGSDGVILIKPSEQADFCMDVYNADGSRAKMCGNGIRCVAKYVYDKGLTQKKDITIDTLSGVKKITLTIEDKKAVRATVNMGKPILDVEKIPVLWSDKTLINEAIAVGGRLFNITAVSMGNPHAVVYVKGIETLPLEQMGPLFEQHKLFPDSVNTEFVEIIDRTHLRMRVWERGSGETMACGTGACATVVASVLNGFSDRNATVLLNGGELNISWREDTGEVIMEGPAEISFEGTVEF
jgi:diaminopimelate epimerase